MESVSVLILDDESHARESISALLNRYLQMPFTTLEAANVDDAVTILREEQIDIAFFDVHLGDRISFEIFSRLHQVDFKVIFVTAHDEYAIRAFRFNASDYLLKPINPLEFQEALRKLDAIKPLNPDEVNKLENDIRTDRIHKIILRDISAIYFVDVADIQYCSSEKNYTTFILNTGEEITISKTIKEYETILKSLSFFRTHRSYLINLDYVKFFDKREGGAIVMKNEKEIPLARNKRESFMRLMNIK